LPKLKESVKLIKLKDEINEKIEEHLEENKSDITDINKIVNAAVTIITVKMNQPGKLG
jgi:ferritin-like metal-binding protein YciE